MKKIFLSDRFLKLFDTALSILSQEVMNEISESVSIAGSKITLDNIEIEFDNGDKQCNKGDAEGWCCFNQAFTEAHIYLSEGKLRAASDARVIYVAIHELGHAVEWLNGTRYETDTEAELAASRLALEWILTTDEAIDNDLKSEVIGLLKYDVWHHGTALGNMKKST